MSCRPPDASLTQLLEDHASERPRDERGVFGIPTIFVGDRMFFGNDCFELVRHFIEKQVS